MKQTLVLSNILLLSVIVFLAIQGGCVTDSTPPPDADTPSYTCTECPDSPPVIPVTAGYFKTLVSNYRNNHWNTMNHDFSARGVKGVDSRSVWFDLNTLKSFIASIEKSMPTTCEGGHCKQGLGIRIYFGEYDKSTTAIPEYIGLHTLVMVPTIKDNSKLDTPEENVDFDPHYMSGCKPGTLPDSGTIVALMPLLSSTMTAMNHGTIVPPPDLSTCTGAKYMHWVDKIDGVSTLSCP